MTTEEGGKAESTKPPETPEGEGEVVERSEEREGEVVRQEDQDKGTNTGTSSVPPVPSHDQSPPSPASPVAEPTPIVRIRVLCRHRVEPQRTYIVHLLSSTAI